MINGYFEENLSTTTDIEVDDALPVSERSDDVVDQLTIDEIPPLAEPEEDDDHNLLEIMDTDLTQNIISNMPINTKIMKHMSQSTMMFQAHDCCKLHSIFKSYLNNDQMALQENIDEDKLPSYMEYFEHLCVHHNVPPTSRRTFFQLVANFERLLDRAVVDADLELAYTRSGQGSFNLRNFLDHWSGRETLREEDFKLIEMVFPLLVDNARVHGTNHPEFVKTILGSFIYDKHVEALSSDALFILAEDELKKPTEERSVNQWGATILTNPGHLANMRQKALDKAAAHTLAIESAELAQIQKEIAKAQAIEKKEASRMKKLAIENRQKREANAVYGSYKLDISVGGARVESHAAPVINSAYKYFVKNYLQPNDAILTKKAERIAALKSAFVLEPPECVIEEDLVDDDGDDEDDV